MGAPIFELEGWGVKQNQETGFYYPEDSSGRWRIRCRQHPERLVRTLIESNGFMHLECTHPDHKEVRNG